MTVVVGAAAAAGEEKEDGRSKVCFETSWSVCDMTGHFLLTNLLLDKLTASSPSRVINTVGVGYDQTNIDFDDFNLEKSVGRRDEAYNRSKLAMALFTVELARRLEGVLSSVVFCIFVRILVLIWRHLG